MRRSTRSPATCSRISSAGTPPTPRTRAASASREATLPRTAAAIPAVPAAAFKDAALSTVAPERAALWFETSGTTQRRSGRHYLESPALYEAALLAGFDRAMLADGAPLRYLDARARSARTSAFLARLHDGDRRARTRRRHRRAGICTTTASTSQRLDRRRRARARGRQPAMCIATTAFALVALLDELAAARHARCRCRRGSRVMETGGFKGRTRVVGRDELYARAARAFAIDEAAIVAEYGMTELSSQYYDSPASRCVGAAHQNAGAVAAPDDRRRRGRAAAGRHRRRDPAHRLREPLVGRRDRYRRSRRARRADGLLLLGREEGAALRGCSLDAEDLIRR